MSPRHAETVELPRPVAEAMIERAALLRRAADLKHAMCERGEYDAATTVAALIRAVR